MTRYYPDLIARSVPRYTSYPTAADFRDDVGAEAMRVGLESVGKHDDLSLYVHIPFCREICAYCGCNTGRANRAQRMQSYCDALDREIGTVAAMLGGRGRVRRIAFGGGSPNALSPVAFVRLVDRLLTRFGVTDPVISLEVDPRSLEPGWFNVIRSVGIRRVSLGVQSFDPAIQRAIGRVQSDALIATVTERLRHAGVSSLNFDLMYGLPGQNRATLAASVARTFELGADRAALFGYAHLPALLPRQRAIDATLLPDARARFDQADLGRQLFLAAGYRAVGFDHFARPSDPLAEASRDGRLRRNFQGFTDDPDTTVIGLGSSAISQFPGAIVQNEKQAGRYRMLAGAGMLAGQRGILLTADMQGRARIIEGLLCKGRAWIDPVRMGREVAALRPFFDRDIVRLSGGLLTLDEGAWPYARLVASLFDSFRPVSAGQFSHAV